MDGLLIFYRTLVKEISAHLGIIRYLDTMQSLLSNIRHYSMLLSGNFRAQGVRQTSAKTQKAGRFGSE